MRLSFPLALGKLSLPRIHASALDLPRALLWLRRTPTRPSPARQFTSTDLRLTLGHVTSSAELAKLDPDTGLQFNEGPSRLRFMTVALRQNFSQGFAVGNFLQSRCPRP